MNYLATYFILKIYYKKDLANSSYPRAFSYDGTITDMKLAKTSGAIALLTIIGFMALSILKVAGIETEINFGTVALLGSAMLYSLSPRMREVITGVNWNIIIFFMSMFIVMQSVWNAGLIGLLASYLPTLTHTESLSTILKVVIASVLLSQVMSNVPFVAVYINLMRSLGSPPLT